MGSNASENLLRFDGRVAIVTGAGGGMGREHAILLGLKGAKVIVNDLFEETADATVKLIADAGGEAVTVSGSVADQDICEKMVNLAIEKYGRVDILINNAGIEIKKTFDGMTKEDTRRMLDVHFWGSWELCKLVWPHMRSQKYGKILIICSTSLLGMHSNSAYMAAKGALYGLGKALATEGEEYNIQTNLLGPVAFTAMAKQMSDSSEWEFQAENLPAAATSPVAVWLVHEECKSNAEFISAYGTNFGRLFMAETRGVICPNEGYTMEIVKDRFSEAFNESGYIVPSSVGDEFYKLLRLRTGQ